MSKPVALAEVVDQLGHYGPRATLISVSAQATPKVNSVIVASNGAGLALRVGRGTRTNLAANPAVSLVWTRDDEDYLLIVDGTARLDGDADDDGLTAVTIDVTSAILHRLADSDGPTCVALDTRQ